MKKVWLCMVLAGLSLLACLDDVSNRNNNVLVWDYGKNTFNMEIDDTLRNFVLHVPASYTGDTLVPLLFMLHGSGGTGDEFYRKSGWVEKADEETFLVVFPTGLEYYLPESGRYTTKWSSDGLVNDVAPGTIIKDDVPFFEEMIELCKTTFMIDTSRIYITGFSNGGGFIRSRIVPEMPDVFAAAATAGGVGLPEINDVEGDIYMPLWVIIGSKDEKIIETSGIYEEIPLSGADFMARADLQHQVYNMLETLQLDTVYVEETSKPSHNILLFQEDISGQGNEYVLMIINDMGHNYPNGKNNPHQLVAADILWPWFIQYTRPAF